MGATPFLLPLKKSFPLDAPQSLPPFTPPLSTPNAAARHDEVAVCEQVSLPSPQQLAGFLRGLPIAPAPRYEAAHQRFYRVVAAASDGADGAGGGADGVGDVEPGGGALLRGSTPFLDAMRANLDARRRFDPSALPGAKSTDMSRLRGGGDGDGGGSGGFGGCGFGGGEGSATAAFLASRGVDVGAAARARAAATFEAEELASLAAAADAAEAEREKKEGQEARPLAAVGRKGSASKGGWFSSKRGSKSKVSL